ncbi:MAG: hypothetical protein H7831_08105 [Magnetococcus sp. WYHC-3]
MQAASSASISSLVSNVISIIEGGIIPLIFALAIFSFLSGIVKYVASAGNEEKRTEGAKLMIYGIVGFAVMIAVWSLVKILTGTFGFEFAIPQIG